ncbi:hypothetical protein CR513_52912, partial [Mucuna pruriens]
MSQPDYRLFDPKAKGLLLVKMLCLRKREEHVGEVNGDELEEDIEFNSSVDNGRNTVKGSGTSHELENSQENVSLGREKKMPIWMRNFVNGQEVEKSTDSEINLVQKNKTWEIMDLPT